MHNTQFKCSNFTRPEKVVCGGASMIEFIVTKMIQNTNWDKEIKEKYKSRDGNAITNTNPEIWYGFVWKMVREWPGQCTGGLLQYKYIRATAKTNDWLESGLSDHHLERELQTNLNRENNLNKCDSTICNWNCHTRA